MSGATITAMPMKAFLAQFVPSHALSELQTEKLREGVCPALRLINLHKSESDHDDMNITAEYGLDVTLDQTFPRCGHSVFFRLVVSMYEGTECMRIIRLTHTSIHATDQFEARTTPWMVQFSMRFTTLHNGKCPCASKRALQYDDEFEEGWTKNSRATAIVVDGRDIIAGQISSTSSVPGPYDYSIARSPDTKEVIIARSILRTRRQGKGKGKQRPRNRITIPDLPPPTQEPATLASHVKAFADVAAALQCAHDPKYFVMHGDVAHHNILLKGLRTGMLVDWEDGKSKKIEKEESWKKELNFVMSSLMKDWQSHGRMGGMGFGSGPGMGFGMGLNAMLSP